MQVNGPFDGRIGSGANRLAAAARSVGKASASGHLGTGQQDSPRQQEKSAPRIQVELVCQDDTKAFDPFWDGPRLQPVFVAQLLGQVMPERRQAVTVETA